jgi:hypothetical protein
LRERVDIIVLIDEHSAELLKPLAERKPTRLQKLVLAFKHIQSLPPTDVNSFFWQGSIHGYTSNEVREKQYEVFKVRPGQPGGIYCHHNVYTFPSWHRPYLHSFENALRTAPGSEDVALPYWDEISPRTLQEGYPKLFDEASFTLVDGTQIANPLQSYTYQSTLSPPDRVKGDKTFRDPIQLLAKLKDPIVPNFKAFYANNTPFLELLDKNSLEAPHGQIHVYVGGVKKGGDLFHVPLAGFEPIFWFHHCFIDRILWAWQQKHSKTTQFLDPRDDRVLLIPFRKTTGNFYNTNDVANIALFNYSYPPFTESNESQLRSHSKLLRSSRFGAIGAADRPKELNSQRVLVVEGIEIRQFGGSFVVSAKVRSVNGAEYDLGEQVIFRSTGECDNCLVNDKVSTSFKLSLLHVEETEELSVIVGFQMQGGTLVQITQDVQAGIPVYKNVFGNTIRISY